MTEPLVILVHGLGEDGREWDRVRTALDGGRRVVATDVRGHGRTPAGDGDGTLEQLRDDLIAVIEQFGGPASLVGYSLGGTIVLAAAAERPDLVDRVVAVATSSVVGRGAVAFYEERVALVEAGDRDALAAVFRADIEASLQADSDVDALVRAQLDAIGDGTGYANAARAMARLREQPLTPELARIEAPVLILSGERDGSCPRRAQEIMLEALPAARHVELDGAGHLMLHEEPERVAAAIAAFLDGD